MNQELKKIANELQSNQYERTGNIYHPLPFPEFDHLTVSTKPKSAYQKWHLIRQTLPNSNISGSHILDIGANAGFYAFNFAQLGATIDAYEPHEHYASIGHRISNATNLQVNWHNKPFEQTDLSSKKYDITLMLSVFQWMSQGNTLLKDATSLLYDISNVSKYLFFELGCNHGKSAISTNEQPIGWLWRFLQEHTKPKSIYYLGSTSAWGKSKRYIFVCTKEYVNLTSWQRFVTYLLRKQWIK